MYKRWTEIYQNNVETYIDIFDKVKDITYLSRGALDNLKNNVLKTNNLNGIIVETGCAKGGSSIVIAYYKRKNKKFNIYDTFSLIPPPSKNDDKNVHKRYEIIKSGKESPNYYGYQNNLLEKVKQTFDMLNLNIYENNINLIKGLYSDTLKINEPVSLAHIDCDWYDSVKLSLKQIEPNLVNGGVLIIDDYYSWSGTKKAVDEYFKDIKYNYTFKTISNKLNIV